MSVETARTFYQSNSYNENSNVVAKPLDLTYFQLDKSTYISAKEIEMLPDSYKEQTKSIFAKVLKNKDVLESIKKVDVSTISLKIQNKKLAYSFDDKNESIFLSDKKTQKAFEKVTRNIKRYLKNTKTIKGRKVQNLTIIDKNIIKGRPFDIRKISADERALKKKYPNLIRVPLKYLRVPLKYFSKFRKSDAEWSLWAVFLSDIQVFAVKSFKFISVELAFLKNIKGWDDWLGYLVGSFGVLNGIENIKDARKIDDREGKYDGIHKIIRNTFAIVGGSIDWIGKAIKTVGHVVIKLALSIIATSVFLFVTLYALVRFVYFDIKAIHFKKKLNEYLKNDKLTDEEKKIGALNFLKDKLMLSKEKSFKILKKIRKENPGFSDDKIEKLFHGKIKKLVETKVKRFERRVGSNVASLIQRNVKQILKDPKNDLNIENINKIFEKVLYKNSVTIHENTVFSLAIALQGIEFILFMIIGFTIPALIPGALSSMLFAYVQGYSFYRRFYLKENKIDKKDEDEIEKKASLISQATI
ncbi:MAG: hypothetical protein KR126chlam5_00962 [Candidatus Anoxychlamydiales bacterium]|nr:hypothetical protein [Candidatus Anoxychlamydiales bacterium]